MRQPREQKLAIIVGARLKAIRHARGLSQIELGKALGLTHQQVQKYESGANNMSIARLAIIAKILKVPLADFQDNLIGEDVSSVLASLNEPLAIQIGLLVTRLPAEQRVALVRFVVALAGTLDEV
jgi:transcriptional regulator with XRE-family HTH domain